MRAVAAGSEWFYPEGPAPLFSAGAGAAPCSSPAMAFTFAAFCYMLALLLTAALIFFAIWHVSSQCRGKGEGGGAGSSRSGPVVGAATAPGGPHGWGWGQAGAVQAARAGVCAPSVRGPGAPGPGGAEASVVWLAACALCVPAQASRAVTPSPPGGAAAVPTGPAGQCFAGRLGIPAFPHLSGECQERGEACYVFRGDEACRIIVI